MATRREIVEQLERAGVIAIIRAEAQEQVLPAVEALVSGGVTALEITMTTPGALPAITESVARFGDRSLVGVGTVLDDATCREAIRAGAEFVVAPIGKASLATAAHELDKPIMLGVYTPTEAQAAHEAGADFVKLFPADGLGPGYIKALRAPLPHLRVVPTGGVNLDTLETFVKAGCPAVGVGSSLVSKDLLRRADWTELSRLAGEFVAALAQARIPTRAD